jgi:hypothetical protein
MTYIQYRDTIEAALEKVMEGDRKRLRVRVRGK